MATMMEIWSGHGAGAWRLEAGALARLSVPIILTNVGQVAIQTTDVVMIGWLGPEALAASVLGINVMFVLLLFGIGVVAATAPMIAQDLGRRPYAVRGPRRTVRQGLWVALALGLLSMTLLWQIAPLLRLLRQDPELIAAAEPFVRAVMWGFVPALWFVVLRNFIASLERPRAAMVIMLIGVSFNAIAGYALIFGRLGLPALGLLGAGIAAALTNWLVFAGLLGYVLADRQFRRFHILGRLWRPDWARLREIVRIGLPIGVTLVMEVGLFAAAGFLIGLIGTAQLAAHQIALQCASVTFMVPLGLAQAATVRVGLAAGAGDEPGILRAGLMALHHGRRLHAGDGDGDVDRACRDRRAVRRRQRPRQCGRRARGGHVPRDRGAVPGLRWRPGDRRGRAARPEGHPLADGVRRACLLGGRRHAGARPWLRRGPRRAWRLARPCRFARGGCRADDRPLPRPPAPRTPDARQRLP